ncbi:hypothetical protein VOLCADRAFT_97134 [Volvox carteri f. nagariensis]|uniref:Uncharacterized protein n=1 Tax=Volvox carteri f. nagariensis TaxID=3068 RepID=D8UBZ1_VOLCA|nr:uncharacterized protein VOLCADRAFT_97134 [Volvox carteri f. nagariensis]EFJ42754.1 hypothetical protein VOLCADRAFT_97134 [Volvox carteri f. nagariensis]|eukprot:XP_002956215.1 hypothetical protein VOLCADRAFT_97134 [Volvox carteri f. nagariensis]
MAPDRFGRGTLVNMGYPVCYPPVVYYPDPFVTPRLPAAGAPRFIVDMTANRGNRTSMPCPASGPSRPCNNGTGSSRRYAMDLTGTDDSGPQQQHRPQPGTSVIEISSDSSGDDDDGDGSTALHAGVCPVGPLGASAAGPSGDAAHRPSTATAGRHDAASTRRRYRKGTDRCGGSCLHCRKPGWKLGCLGPAGEREDVVQAPARNRSLPVMWPDQHQQPPGLDDLQFAQFRQFQDFLACDLVTHVFVFRHSAADGVRGGRPDWLSVQYKVSDDR